MYYWELELPDIIVMIVFGMLELSFVAGIIALLTFIVA